MISLSDAQLAMVMTMARDLPPEKRSVYFERINGILRRFDNRYISDSAVADAAAKALRGLVQPAA